MKLSVLHDECVDAFVAGHVDKAKMKRAKELDSLDKTAKKIKYEKSITTTQTLFNRSVRAFHANEQGFCKCVTCGRVEKWDSGTMDAGHFKSRGARSDLRFERKLIFPQCRDCNSFHSGKPKEFEAFLVELYGRANLREIVGVYKSVKHDLKAIRAESREIIKSKGL